MTRALSGAAGVLACLVVLVAAATGFAQAPSPSVAALRQRQVEYARTNPGDAAAGAKAIGKLSCLSCHDAQGNDNLGGPPLSTVGRRLGREELIEKVQDPKKRVTPGYSKVRLEFRDGRVVVATLLHDGPDALRIRDDATGAEKVVAKADLAGYRITSGMPTGQADRLTPEEFADLIAYLESLK
jgi:putative heme-binding domain-containing protein